MNDVRHRFAAVGLLLVACLGMAMGLRAAGADVPMPGHSVQSEGRQRVIDIQVLSQQIALFAEKAASGHGPAFAALQAARDRMQLNLDMLREGSTPALIAKVGAGERTQFSGIAGYENVPRMQEPLRRLIAAWAQVDGRVQSVLDHRELVSGLPETAGAFSAMVPQLQAQMDEVVRSMNESGAATAQIYVAVRQVVLLDRMSRSVMEIERSGAGAVSAVDRLDRDAAMFGQVLAGLQEGDAERGIARVHSPAAHTLLGQMAERYAGMHDDAQAILDTSAGLREIKETSEEISVGSAELLEAARSLDAAIAALPDDNA